MDQVEVNSQVEVNTATLDQHEKRLDKIDVVIDKIRNRLPLWASVVFAGLVGILGWFAKG